jgi:hypothetical protein
MGSYTRPEHEACVTSLRNGGRLNRLFELGRLPMDLDRSLILKTLPRL